MFCIAAFVILVVLGIFSARYRRLAREAWKCVSKKATFRKCDTSFKEDLKSQILAKHAVKRPRLARFLDRWIDVLAWVFIIVTIWSLFVVVKSGLNLFVYDTCNPNNAESCSLGGEACSVNTGSLGFWTSVKSGKVFSWAADEASQFTETVSRIPDRLKEWQPEEYLPPNPTYLSRYDENKPTVLEIIDPGCQYCAKLYRNIKEANAQDRYNITYLVYPIPDATQPSGYKFQHSPLIAAYLEATKLQPLETEIPADWQLLDRLFTWDTDRGISYQLAINTLYDESRTKELLHDWLVDIGYTSEQAKNIEKVAGDTAISDNLQAQKSIVEDKLHTVKIPTVLLNGRRYDGVVETEKLR